MTHPEVLSLKSAQNDDFMLVCFLVNGYRLPFAVNI